MFHVVEFEGVRKTVKASPRATCTDVAALAFGFDPWGDARTARMTVIGSTKSKDVAAGMMCKVWPAKVRSAIGEGA